MKIDIVKEILSRVLEAAARGDGSFTDSMAREIERQIRYEYGGEEMYVARRPRDKRAVAAAVSRDYLDGSPVPDICDAHGVSRATLYKMLKRRD